MECTIVRLLKDADGVVTGAFGYWRPSGEFVAFKAKSVVLATGGIGKAWKFTSNSWESTGDGHALAPVGRRRPHRHGVRPVPPHRHGVAAVGAGHPRHRGRARRRRRPSQLRGRAVHVRLHPRDVRGRDGRHRGGGRPLVRRPGQQPAPTGAPAPRRGGPGHQLRGQGRPGQPRTAACSSTSPPVAAPSTSSAGFRRCTTSSRSWPTSTSPPSPWRSGPPATT